MNQNRIKHIIQQTTDPYENLAMEESLFEHLTEDLIYLWRNKPAVIIGRHQNTLAEVDMNFAEKHDIEVLRRITGGGAVYQDLGNINVSYLFHCKADGGDFDEKVHHFLDRFLAWLQTKGISPVLSGRNDICIYDGDGCLRKIAGTAMTQKENRGIFHLCLLFDVNMSHMAQVLTPPIEKLQTKGVTSVRSRTANLAALCPQFQHCSSAQFFHIICTELTKDMPAAELTIATQQKTAQLVSQRYKNNQWIFGRNPAGNFFHTKRFPIGTVNLAMEVSQGKIAACTFSGDFLTAFPLEDLAKTLTGVGFDRLQLETALEHVALENILHIEDRSEWIDFLLGRSTSCTKSY